MDKKYCSFIWGNWRRSLKDKIASDNIYLAQHTFWKMIVPMWKCSQWQSAWNKNLKTFLFFSFPLSLTHSQTLTHTHTFIYIDSLCPSPSFYSSSALFFFFFLSKQAVVAFINKSNRNKFYFFKNRNIETNRWMQKKCGSSVYQYITDVVAIVITSGVFCRW